MERNGIQTERGDQFREIDARNQERLRRQAADLISEYETASAVDRLREEEREAEKHRPSLDPARRGLLSAIWTLTRTMGGSLSHIVLGADRSDLIQGRTVHNETREAQRERERAARTAAKQSTNSRRSSCPA
jgi:hypothetical protein